MVWKSWFLQEQRERTDSFLKALHLRTSEKCRTSLKYNKRDCLKAEHLLWLHVPSPRGTTSFLLLTKQLLLLLIVLFLGFSYLILPFSLCKVLGKAAVSNNNYIRENLESTVLKWACSWQVNECRKWEDTVLSKRAPSWQCNSISCGLGPPALGCGQAKPGAHQFMPALARHEMQVHVHAMLSVPLSRSNLELGLKCSFATLTTPGWAKVHVPIAVASPQLRSGIPGVRMYPHDHH